jgi:hypothetical protein
VKEQRDKLTEPEIRSAIESLAKLAAAAGSKNRSPQLLELLKRKSHELSERSGIS